MNTSIASAAASSTARTMISRDPAGTMAVGQQLGTLLQRGDLVLLIGTFGAGKTHLTKGIAHGLGAAEMVTSPSFVLINEYRANTAQGRFPIYHVDLYRLESLAEIAGIGLEDVYSGDGVCIIEWAEKASGWLPAEHLAVYLSYIDENTRELRFEPHGERYQALVQSMHSAYAAAQT